MDIGKISPAEIKEILLKSGYLFEQQVATTLEKEGFYVVTNKAYLDLEENKSREIDIVAHKQLFQLTHFGTQAFGVCYFNCECKNSTNPLVFITRKKASLDKYYTPDGIHLIEQNRSMVSPFQAYGLYEHHFATKIEDKAVQLCKIVRNGNKIEAQHGGIIESLLYPLIKSKDVWESQLPKDTSDRRYCKVVFNLIITNSALYTIDSMDEDAIPRETYFVPFIREIQNSRFSDTFLVTFVNYDRLQNFINEQIVPFFEEIEKVYIENPNRYSFVL